MNARRTLATTSAALLLLASLTACFGIPTIGGGAANSVSGTTWSGTDTDGDTWTIEFTADHTVGLTYDDNGPFDDTSDTWAQSGDTVTVHVAFDDGPVDLTGSYTGGNAFTMDGSYTDSSGQNPGTFTLPLTKG